MTICEAIWRIPSESTIYLLSNDIQIIHEAAWGIADSEELCQPSKQGGLGNFGVLIPKMAVVSKGGAAFSF